MTTLKIGVVGYSGQKFDERKARELLVNALDEAMDREGVTEVVIVSGLTDVGIPSLAYYLAKANDWKTVGVACAKAKDYPCFPVDNTIIVGSEWGDESEAFLAECDVLIRIGGGDQARKEAEAFKAKGGMVIERELRTLNA